MQLYKNACNVFKRLSKSIEPFAETDRQKKKNTLTANFVYFMHIFFKSCAVKCLPEAN